MTKNTLRSLVAYLTKNPIAELADATVELVAEMEKNEAKARANREMYSEAKDIVMAVISTDEPMTVAQIYEACKNDLPETFSKSKVQYAVREYWADEIVKHENCKGPLMYTKRA